MPAKLSPTAGLDAADHARAAAERDHRRIGIRGPVEHRNHVRFGARRATTSGASLKSRAKMRTALGNDLP